MLARSSLSRKAAAAPLRVALRQIHVLRNRPKLSQTRITAAAAVQPAASRVGQRPHFQTARDGEKAERSSGAGLLAPLLAINPAWGAGVPDGLPGYLPEWIVQLLYPALPMVTTQPESHSTWFWWMAELAQSYFGLVQSTTGLPWWGAIALGTVILRAGPLFAIGVRQQRNVGKFALIKEPMAAIQKDFDEIKAHHAAMKRLPDSNPGKKALVAAAERKEKEGAILVAGRMQALQAKHQISLVGMLGPAFLSIPFFMSCFFGLQELHFVYPEIVDGGALWFQNLGAPDQTCRLPILTNVLLAAMMKLGTETGGMDAGQMNPNLMKFITFMPIMAIPFMIKLESAVFVYFIVNNIWSLGQARAFQNASVRKALGIPPLPPKSDKSKVVVAAPTAEDKLRAQGLSTPPPSPLHAQQTDMAQVYSNYLRQHQRLPHNKPRQS